MSHGHLYRLAITSLGPSHISITIAPDGGPNPGEFYRAQRRREHDDRGRAAWLLMPSPPCPSGIGPCVLLVTGWLSPSDGSCRGSSLALACPDAPNRSRRRAPPFQPTGARPQTSGFQLEERPRSRKSRATRGSAEHLDGERGPRGDFETG